jgi:hypothetical protein
MEDLDTDVGGASAASAPALASAVIISNMQLPRIVA